MTGLGTVTPKDLLKPLKPSVGQQQKADTHVPAWDYCGEEGGRGGPWRRTKEHRWQSRAALTLVPVKVRIAT